jgi:hypothetical protein
MKLSLLLFLLLTFTGHAQDWHSNEYTYGELYKGYIILKDGEKIAGHIKYQNRVKMQDEIVFYRDKDLPETKTRYYPKELLEYQVGDKYYHVLDNYGSKVGFTPKAVLVINEGCLISYVYYERSAEYNKLVQGEDEESEEWADRKYPKTRLVKEKGSSEIYKVDDMQAEFDKIMSKLVRSNKELSNRVKQKVSGYTYDRFDHIVEEFNNECTKQD